MNTGKFDVTVRKNFYESPTVECDIVCKPTVLCVSILQSISTEDYVGSELTPDSPDLPAES